VHEISSVSNLFANQEMILEIEASISAYFE